VVPALTLVLLKQQIKTFLVPTVKVPSQKQQFFGAYSHTATTEIATRMICGATSTASCSATSETAHRLICKAYSHTTTTATAKKLAMLQRRGV